MITPLVTAAVIFALGSLAKGEQPGAARCAAGGLDVFAPLFVAVLLVAAGIALGLLAFDAARHLRPVRW